MAEEFDYKHYMLGDSVPVRVLFDQQNGLKAGAEIPDRHTGELKFDNSYLSRIEQSSEVREISAEDFEKQCEKFLAKKNNKPKGLAL